MEAVRATPGLEKTRRPAVRLAYLACGIACVGLGYIGIIVPGMPSTVFFIGALWAFKRSSPRFESWLLNHSVFGPTLRDWDENRLISKKTKILAIATMALFISISIVFVHKPWVRLILAATFVLVSLYIATRNSSRSSGS